MIAAVPPEYKESIEKRIALTEALCHALRNYLCADLDQTLKNIAEATPHHAHAPECLVRAQSNLEATRQKIATLEGAPEPFGIMADLLLPDLRLQLEREEREVSEIQKGLEEQAQ